MPQVRVHGRLFRALRSWRHRGPWPAVLVLGVGVASMVCSAALPAVQPHALAVLVAYLVAAAWCSDLPTGLAALAVSSSVCLLLHPHAVGLRVDVLIVGGATLALLVRLRDRRQAQEQADQARGQAQRERHQAQAAHQQAAEALGLRDAFVSAAAHDLRTPLTNILGRADLLQMHLQGGRPLDPAWLQTQTTALRYSAKRMQALVEEIADAARLQEGQRVPLHLSAVDVGAIVQTVVAQMEAPRVTMEVGPTGRVRGDAARLERVIENVLHNALKYSPAHHPVSVTVGQEGAWVVVQVQDQGVGIPQDEVAHVFTRYYRASTADGIPGTGLGLAGSKHIVEQHGGYIMLESTLGTGTTVTLYLPVEAGEGRPSGTVGRRVRTAS